MWRRQEEEEEEEEEEQAFVCVGWDSGALRRLTVTGSVFAVLECRQSFGAFLRELYESRERVAGPCGELLLSPFFCRVSMLMIIIFKAMGMQDLGSVR